MIDIQLLLVHEGITFAFFGLVAVQTVDAGLTMAAMVPFQRQAGVLGHVALDAFFAIGVAPVFADFTAWAGANGDAGCKTERYHCDQPCDPKQSSRSSLHPPFFSVQAGDYPGLVVCSLWRALSPLEWIRLTDV